MENHKSFPPPQWTLHYRPPPPCNTTLTENFFLDFAWSQISFPLLSVNEVELFINSIHFLLHINVAMGQNKFSTSIFFLKVSQFQNVLFLSFRVFQKTNEIFSRISTLASKKRSNQKIGESQNKNPPISGIKCPYVFDLTSFYRQGQKSWKNFVWFLEYLKTPKGHFKINWPLVQ